MFGHLPDLPVLVELEYEGARLSVYQAAEDPYPTARLQRNRSIAGAGFEGYVAIGGDDDPAFVAGQLQTDADRVEIEGGEVLSGPICARGHWVAVVVRPPSEQILVHEMRSGERRASSRLDV